MRCPRCGHAEDKVIDSRAARNEAVIRRRRMCLGCGKRFTTYEEVVKPRMQVVKRDGRREEFDRRKLVAGILRACEKRPVAASDIESMVDAIIDQMESEFESEVPSERIGKAVMDRLEATDDVAYVRFASVYRRFQDLNQFLSAIEGLIKK
ncbi:MAG: transcriptional repressor NrdR [Lentisphaerae bacterium]|nr:transcriptional repressor NrdR [Lentisphaerota bacterium]